MNFLTFTGGGAPSLPTQQAAAFEAYIAQDNYLSEHRGEYARARRACSCRSCTSMDLSMTQDVFKNIKGKRNAGQFRIDIQNFGNLLNSNWGVGQRVIRNNILTHAGRRMPQGRLQLPHAGGQQPVGDATRSNRRAASDDVYQFMLSFRYSFN